MKTKKYPTSLMANIANYAISIALIILPIVLLNENIEGNSFLLTLTFVLTGILGVPLKWVTSKVLHMISWFDLKGELICLIVVMILSFLVIYSDNIPFLA